MTIVHPSYYSASPRRVILFWFGHTDIKCLIHPKHLKMVFGTQWALARYWLNEKMTIMPLGTCAVHVDCNAPGRAQLKVELGEHT